MVDAVVDSVCGADVETTLVPTATSAGAFLSGAGTALAACCTTPCSGRAATTEAGAGAGVVAFALAAAGADALECGLAAAGTVVAVIALAATGLVAVASAGEAAAGAVAAGLAAFEAAGALEVVVDPVVVDAGGVAVGAVGELEGAVETTTVVDLTSVVVQPSEVVVALEEGAADGVVVLPALDGTFEPAGAAGDGGGEACLAAVSVVSRGAVMVVSRRAVAVFDALRTLSVGRAGEADRAVARRTCSIIAE